MDTVRVLNGVFCEVFNDDAIVIARETTADDIEGWDSLSHVNLIVAVEMKFNIRFAVREVQSLQNVGDLIDLINKKIEKQRLTVTGT